MTGCSSARGMDGWNANHQAIRRIVSYIVHSKLRSGSGPTQSAVDRSGKRLGKPAIGRHQEPARIGHSFTGHSKTSSDTVNGRPDRCQLHGDLHTASSQFRRLLACSVTVPITAPARTGASDSLSRRGVCVCVCRREESLRPRLAVWTPPRFGLVSHFGERANHTACAVQRRDGSPCCLWRVGANTSAHISRVPGPGSDILVPSPASGTSPGCPCTPPACLGYQFTRAPPR
ncbi:hypothetical protein COCMIDRAFT_23556 [Bipolaris oryzae ATCC 44560]|uniref:Uncharacterized protein n=1 Tax=Bipolaris oryzae ATCC 44560 TaxID=930090 RepID=W6ZYN5_COCMI|nr:uncharacterized protein COCMIDRAFT_23556 [Bipolaris oryzae ATCC 44560]EUC48791.1 hypothetical protein COCMIDRAFT_23556 [Bipolaris oryzae ATCC 44560]